MDQVFVAVSNLAAVEEGLDGESGIVIEGKWKWWSVWVEVRGIGIRFEEIDIEDGMEAREIRRESKEVSGGADFAGDRVRTETVVIELG